MLTRLKIATLLVCARPFNDEELDAIQSLAATHSYDVVLLGDRPGHESILTEILATRTIGDLDDLGERGVLRSTPPTDECPYFFNMLRLGGLASHWPSEWGIVAGNLKASLVQAILIACLTVLAVVTIVAPLALRGRVVGAAATPVAWSGAVYFALIGAGFMLVEIAMIQNRGTTHHRLLRR